MPLTRSPAPPVPPARIAPRPMAPPPQRVAAPHSPPSRVQQGPAGTNGAPPTRTPIAAQQATQHVQAVSPTADKEDLAIRSVKLRYYTAAALFYEMQNSNVAEFKKAAPVARPSASAPSAATAQTAPTPAADGPVKRPVGRPPGRPPASPPTQQAPAPVQPALPVAAQSTSAGEVPSADVLAGMTRKDLVEMAKGMGLETQGVKGEDLRVMIANHGGAPAQEVGAQVVADLENGGSTVNEQYMEARATINMGLIDANLDKFESMIDPNSTDPTALKCGGDCVRCPNPGNFPHAADQVASCYKELHSDLGLEQQYPVEDAA